ncbi:hypothetical protein FH972_015149 [Carpinus fangiana]|uniref:Uncharacterized protein n=1 Tax=Carpinus fangiana TaxID=176857 RepID=A0A5N6RC70_9ROSI|nr:hypothetical protein FH972_015149 [Carpinus fangiana]
MASEKFHRQKSSPPPRTTTTSSGKTMAPANGKCTHTPFGLAWSKTLGGGV